MAPDESKQFREKKKTKKESLEMKKGKRMYLKEGGRVEKSADTIQLLHCSLRKGFSHILLLSPASYN